MLMETLWLKTGNQVYLSLYKFWVKIFGLAFGLGVVTGIPLSYEFGTNFTKFSDVAGPVIGPLLGVEVMTAFFLEASFIGVMIFGWKRVSPKVHYLATCLVVLGTHNSAFWVIAANSWMHTPQGVEMVNGILEVTNWWEVIFNPSFPYRLTHMIIASYISGSLLITGVCARYILLKEHIEIAKKGFSLALLVLSILTPLQILVGDLHGLSTLKHQPAKVAAIEALWETSSEVPLVLFAIPNIAEQKNNYVFGIPKLGNLILTHSYSTEVKGLKEWAPEDRPNSFYIFYSFRIMVGLGLLFTLMAFISVVLRLRNKLYDSKLYLYMCVLLTPTGFIATLCGWYVTEVGRQPWIIYNIMRTKDAASHLPAHVVATSLSMFVINLYSTIYLIHVLYTSFDQEGPSTFSN